MAASLRDLYPDDLSYIKDQANWLHHIWTMRPLCSHQTMQAEKLRETLMQNYPEEKGTLETLNTVLGYGSSEAMDFLDDLSDGIPESIDLLGDLF